MKLRILLPVVSLILTALPAAAQDNVLVHIDDLETGDVVAEGFELDRGQEVRIEATGLDPRRHGDEHRQLANAWILDAESRELVWDLATARPYERRRDLRDFDSAVKLESGAYEVYYATFPMHDWAQGGGHWWEKAARSVARAFGWDDYEAAVQDLRLEIRGAGRRLTPEDLRRGRARLRDEAIVTLEVAEDRQAEEQGFELERPMEVLVYAVGELEESGGYDYGWIVDAESRKKVWSMKYHKSEAAGGAEKNRSVHEVVSLPAGRYAAFFSTDGSHSPAAWNTLPPHDPAFWGVTLWARQAGERRYAKRFDYEHLPSGDDTTIAELTGFRNDEHRSTGFTLKAPMDVRIYALGEGTGRDEMVDYGWIVSARTRERVWSMRYQESEHAGGGSKNRLIDEVVRLEPGDYIVGYVTDDSHAYRDWNTDPPAYPERWGITLYGPQGFDRSLVTEYREAEDPSVLAHITQVRSGSHRQREFALDRAAEISIYALGEGIDGEMYDYAWLEDGRGRVVWEMTYRMTDAAGGHAKNRFYQGTLRLEAGDYVLHYKTDDSHAYRDWNASPPHDPDAWGIRVAVAD